MKKFRFLLLSLLALLPAAVPAQRIALGERMPEIRPAAWVAQVEPAPAAKTYIEFFAAGSPACVKSLQRLRALAADADSGLRVIVVTRDREEVVAPLVQQLLSPRFTVALDPQGKIFASYGVDYVPFGVLTDARNRALWQGNSLQLTEETIEKSR